MVTGKCTDVFSGIFFCLGGSFEGGGVTWEDISVEKPVLGEENFNEGGAGFSSIILKKNNEKINMKSFVLLKVRISIKT